MQKILKKIKTFVFLEANFELARLQVRTKHDTEFRIQMMTQLQTTDSSLQKLVMGVDFL